MAQFHALAIKEVKRETPECVSIAFHIPEEKADAFAYKQGQYITLKMQVNGEELRRSYSACSSPLLEEDLRIAVKEVEDGRASSYLNRQAAPGMQIEVMPPMGNFTVDMPADRSQNFVAFAAGSGITPILSLLKSALVANSSNTFTLFYGNRERKQIIFAEALQELEQKYGERLKVVHVLSREASDDPLFEGRISDEKCQKLFQRFPRAASADHYFLCGPFDMIQNLRGALQDMNIDADKVHFELFTTEPPAANGSESSTAADAVAGESGQQVVELCKVTVILDGDETEVEVSKEDNILDAILDAGLDAPYACTGGSCCTCRAKVLEGSAIMDVNYALSDREVEDGYILTCQSHPTTERMTVDYDAP